MNLFFDSYAIIEITNGNPKYEKFQGLSVITSVLNIGEIYQLILRKHSKDIADEWFRNFNCEFLEITPEIIVDAIYFRFINKKKDLSLVDAVGYILSLRHKLKFLTGDRQFKELPNVEFVKS